MSLLSGAAVRGAARAPHLSSAPRPKVCSPCSRCVFFFIGAGAVRHRPAGRVRRAHLRAGARAAALHRGGGAGGGRGIAPTVRDAADLGAAAHGPGYRSDAVRWCSPTARSGCAVCASSWRRRSRSRCSSRHADDPEENQWFGSVQQLAAGARPQGRDAGRSQHRRVDRRGRGARSRILCFPSTTATCWMRPGSPCRACGALNMHGSLLPKYRGRAPGALGHHSRRDRRPAPACTTWWRSPMPARWWISNRCRSWRTTRRSTCR